MGRMDRRPHRSKGRVMASEGSCQVTLTLGGLSYDVTTSYEDFVWSYFWPSSNYKPPRKRKAKPELKPWVVMNQKPSWLSRR